MGSDRVRITAELADAVKMIALPTAAQKLFLALVYMQEQTNYRWIRQGWEGRAEAEFFCTLNDLRALGCAPKAGNTRFFQNAVEALERTDLFTKIALDVPGNLTWSFSAGVWQCMSVMEPYGLMKVGDIAELAGRLDLLLLTQIVVQRGKMMPEFVLTGLNLGFQTADLAAPGLLDLRKTRRRLEPALAKWSRYLGSPVFVGYEQRAHAPGYAQARIRFKSASSVWTNATIRKFPINTKVIIVGFCPAHPVCPSTQVGPRRDKTRL